MTEVFTFGEAMIRLSVPAGEHLETAATFAVDVAGAEANVAVALARLGRRVEWWSRLPDDPLGRRVRDRLAAAGVDCAAVRLEGSGRVGTYFVELHPPPRATLVVYHREGSPASRMSVAEFPWTRLEAARWLHVTGITPALSPTCRELTKEVVERARAAGCTISFDVNHRAKLWSVDEAAPVLLELVRAADLVLCTREDAASLFGIVGRPEEVRDELARRSGGEAVVVTDGERGAWWRRGAAAGKVEAVPVTVIDRLGAGDAFAAGVIDGMLDGDLEVGVRQGVVLGALALTTRGDQVVVSRTELDALMAGRMRRVDR